MNPTRFEGAYIAYPIDQRGPASLTFLFDQIEKVKSMLIEQRIAAWAFDPGDAFKVGQNVVMNHGIMRINRSAARNADCLVAFLPGNVASVGVPMEIDRAVNDGIPVLVFSDAPSWMLQYNSPRFKWIWDWEDDALDLGMSWLSMQQKAIDRKIMDPLPFLVGPDGTLPTQSYEGDAGFDLYASADTTLAPGTFVDVPCDLRVELPFYVWGMVTGRSSTLREKGLLVHPGVIDQGYRGELFAGAWNTTKEAVEVKKGERIAQLIPLNNASRMMFPMQAQQLTPSVRGTRGFGSSGS